MVGTLGNPYSSLKTNTWKLLCFKPLPALVSTSSLMCEISPSALLSAFLKCSILDIIFLSAVYAITGLPKFLDKSCFTHKSKIIKGSGRAAVARWVSCLGTGPRRWGGQSRRILQMSLSNSLPRWRWQRGCCCPAATRASPCSAWPGAAHSSVGSRCLGVTRRGMGGHQESPGPQQWWGWRLYE